MLRKLTVIAIAALSMANASVAQERISLNTLDGGAHWDLFRKVDTKSTRPTEISKPGYEIKVDHVDAIVPGSTFAAYVAAERVADPEYSDNIYQVDESWFNVQFWYRTEFDTPAHAGKRVWLCFENTNRWAAMWVNGKKVSSTSETSLRDISGHMQRSRFDITDVLNSDGKNALVVLITDPDQKKKRTSSDVYGVACSPSYLAGAGWDWMPYVPGRLAGITGNVYLEMTGDVRLVDPWVRTEMPASCDKADLMVKTDVQNASATNQTAELSGVIMPGNIQFSKTLNIPANSTKSYTLTKSDFAQFAISNPKLWWPNGYGEPNLYTAKFTLKCGDVVSDEKEVTFGIKKYSYQMRNNSGGQPVLEFYINGKRIYIKGGNWGMSEYLLRCHGKEYDTRIKLHKDLNFNMIRLWTGCVTDPEFYDYCDKYGIMVWDDFWWYSSFVGIAEPQAFYDNAREKVRRLRNHPSIALWCGANETTPYEEFNTFLRQLITDEDMDDRMYKPCSNNDGASGSGWWSAMNPNRYFHDPSNAMAWSGYPFSETSGYGMRSEIGMCTFPAFESVKLFMPEENWWPLPSDEVLENSDESIWNRHFFGKEGSNAGPKDYKNTVNSEYGPSNSLEEFCEKAQLMNLEDMKGYYEAWNEKIWNDASGLLVWMSQAAYPSFVWQLYDYYFDATGCYWGAKKACEMVHIQWDSYHGKVSVINTTLEAKKNLTATVKVYNKNGKEITAYKKEVTGLEAVANDKTAVCSLNLKDGATDRTSLMFLHLELRDASGALVSENDYWTNADSNYTYTQLQNMHETEVTMEIVDRSLASEGKYVIALTNHSNSVSFANRIRFVSPGTFQRILPVIMSDNYITLMPGETRKVTVEFDLDLIPNGAYILRKQFHHDEYYVIDLDGHDISDVQDVISDKHVLGDDAMNAYSYAPGMAKVVLSDEALLGSQVVVYNLMGAEVTTHTMEEMSEVITLPGAGVYVVTIQNRDAKISKKVIIK